MTIREHGDGSMCIAASAAESMESRPLCIAVSRRIIP